MPVRTTTRIAIVEDHTLLAEAMEIALMMEGHEVRRVTFPDAVRSSSVLLPTILRSTPRVVLLDLDLGTCGNGLRLVEPLTQAGVAVVVVTGNTDRATWGEAVRYGARTVLPKDSAFNDILATIRRIAEGLAVLSRPERDALVRIWQQQRHDVHEARTRLERLTRREGEVLAHLMAGHQVRDIARLSVVSEATIRTQVKSILSKLDVGSQIAAVGAARHADWRPPQIA
jgi:two-component system nitrate/nitrite response regulator NarL